MKVPDSKHIQIAGFKLGLYSTDSQIELEEGYLPFCIEDNSLNDITIDCFSGIPDISLSIEQLVFEAKNDVQKFYSIYKIGNGLIFKIFNQEHINTIQQIAILDESLTHWKIYSEPLLSGNILPLRYPMGPILMYYLTIKFDAVLMHASCAFDGTKSRIFTGFSGVGKSTMSKIWSDAGCGIVNDDRLIIRKNGISYTVYNTPMYYQDIPKEAPLNFIYLISHSPENKAKKVTGAMAISKVMAFCIQNNFDERFVNSHLNFFAELCNHVPVYELGFVPDEKIVPFILTNEAGGNK